MIYQSDNFSLDTQSYVLLRDGEPRPVEPQVFDLLVYLIEHRDRVVTRDELLDNLWNGRIVSESALNGRLKIARKAVGDNGKQQKIIKTIHRRGYQFIAGVRTETNDAAAEAFSASPSEAADDKPSVAVMPFKLVGQSDDVDYLAGGLTDVIITALCRYRELLVIAHESVHACAERGLDLNRAAAELGARYLVSGQVQRSGNQVRVSIRLINAASDETMWAEQIDRLCDDILSLEDEVASRIATSLVSHIESESIRCAERKRPENMTVYDYVVRARKDVECFEAERTQNARQLLEQAVALDSNYAPAHALMAWTYCAEAESAWGLSREEAIDRAEQYARKAVELDDYDSDTHVVLGWIYRLQSKYDLSEIHNNRAIERNPNDYNAYCGRTWLLAICGRADEAMACVETSMRLNPLAPDDCLLAIVLTEYLAQKYEDALDTTRRILAPNLDSEALRAACLAQLGRDDEARRAARSALDLGGDFMRQGWTEGWNFKRQQDRDHVLDGFYKAGVLPDPARAVQKPSLLVLRFGNLSSDPEQAYFAEGMVLNLTSRLCRIRPLKVMSANHIDTGRQSHTAIARDYDADYLLAGSVQRDGDRVRVHADLIDGEDGAIRWSELFESAGQAVMDIQDEIATAITATLWGFHGTLHGVVRDKRLRKMTHDFDAFDYVLKGITHKERYTHEEMRLAHACFAKATELDPACAEAYGWNAWASVVDIVMGWSSNRNRAIDNAVADAERAVAIDPDSEMGHWSLGGALFMKGDYERGFAEYRKALQFNPNNTDLMMTLGTDLASTGRCDEGLEYIDRAIHFNRHPPEWYYWHQGLAYFCADRPEQAIETFNRMSQLNKDVRIHLAASYVQLGYHDQAREQAAELLREEPDFDIGEVADSHYYYNDEILQRLVGGLEVAIGEPSAAARLRLI